MTDNINIPGETAIAVDKEKYIFGVDKAHKGKDETITIPLPKKAVKPKPKCMPIRDWLVKTCEGRRCAYYDKDCDEFIEQQKIDGGIENGS